MKILLDTHTFLWYINGDKQLSAQYVAQLRSPDNTLYLSVVSLWEAIIKYQLGKLPLPQPAHLYLPAQRRRHQILNLDVDEDSLLPLATLSSLHRDPFDRLLICQAIANDMLLATLDEQIGQYPIRIVTAS
jgi:PIN domain nuclease of toxin-antitoxin system